MVGRDREQALLRELLDATIAGHGALVLISGEAGIGKTTLVEDLAQRAIESDVLILTGGCYDLATTPPYGPWIEILREYPESDARPALPDQLRPGARMAGIDSQAALFDLIGRFLESIAETQPLLILLEDLHWSDPASLDLLRYLSRTLSDSPLLLTATYRDDEITRNHPLSALLPPLVREGRAQRFELQRIEPAAIQEIVRQRYQLDPHNEARLLGYLDDLAEGNPFFVHELLYTLEGQRLLYPDAGGWRLADLTEAGVPSLVQQVIDGRLGRLDTSTRGLLDLAAAIDYDTPLELLFELQGGASAALDAALQQAVDHHLLRLSATRQSVRFSHALVRQAIYEKTPIVQRQSYHRQIGVALAARARPDSAVVANHFYQAGDARALEWLERAAKNGQGLFAPASVVDHADRGIALASRLGREAPLKLYRLRGLARESIGDFDGARADHESMLQHARDQVNQHAEWQALLDLGALWGFRDYQRTREYCEQAVALARAMGDPVALAHSLNRLGNWQTNADLPLEGMRHHEDALEIFERLEDLQGIASTLDLLGLNRIIAGDLVQSLAIYERVIPLLRQLDDQQTLASALTNADVAAWGAWNSRGARVLGLPASLHRRLGGPSLEAAEISRSIDWRAGEAYAVALAGLIVAAQGDLRTGFQMNLSAARLAQSIEHHTWMTQAQVNFGSIYVDLWLHGRARPHLAQALELSDLMSSAFFKLGAVGWLASGYIRAGEIEAAEVLLRAELDWERLPDTIVSRNAWFAVPELYLAKGEPDAALEIVDMLIDSLPPGNAPMSPDLARLRGEIMLACERLEEAEVDLAEARHVAMSHKLVLVLWRVLAAQRRLFLMQRRAREAEAAGANALRIVEDLAGQLDDEDLRAEFLLNARGQIFGPMPNQPEKIPFGLTPREVEILGLIAAGRSNREMAADLFLSVRTVERHITNIYGKVGARSRAEATAYAFRNDLTDISPT